MLKLKEKSNINQLKKNVSYSLLIILSISALTNVLLLTSPLYMMAIFDKVMMSFQFETLYLISILAFLSLVTYGVIEWGRSHILFKVGNWLENQLTPLTLEASLTATHNGNHVGAQGIRDLAQVKSLIGGRALLPLLDAPWACIFLIILFSMNVWLGVFTLITAFILFGLTLISEFSTRKHQTNFHNKQNQSQIWLDQSIKNADEILALGMNDALIERFQEKRLDAQNDYLLSQERSSSLLALARTIRILSQVAIMGIAAFLLLKNQVSPGMVVAGSILMSRALSPIEQLMGSWSQLLTGRNAYSNLVSLFNDHLSTLVEKAVLQAPKNTLSVNHLTISKQEKAANNYQAKHLTSYLLHGIHFDLEKGDILAVLGQSGAGKSSLSKALVGLLKPTAGEIRLDGNELNQWSSKNLSNHVGYLPQEVNLAPATIWENIARLDSNAKMEDVYQAAKKAGAHAFIQELPDGYNTKLTTNTPQLSGGQKQSIGFARALYQNPFLLVLDEPDAYLDAQSCESLKTTLQTLSQEGSLIVFISHKPNMIDIASKAIVLDKGRLVGKGLKDDVLKRLKIQMQPSQKSSKKN
ncbi:type I secretion system permease/ATPase [Marinomonas sp. PE14-40]|uniref:type I secretion system permease/ATPase n=1 Tax=Marinomonas sp. PE14-40 TaxID=3060621 RepID=UPI003F675711